MKIDKSCKTCEFCFHENNKRVCASTQYGKTINDFKTQRDCWEIGLEYWMKLQEELTKEENAILCDLVPSKYKRKVYEELKVKSDTEYLLKIISEK